jgi:hypothetical protein
MKVLRKAKSSTSCRILDGRLAAYLSTAGAVSAAMASEAQAIVVGNNTVQPFGVNGAVSIDFNQDGQTDFQVDHDRVTLPSGGPTLDYLQIDKNDINGESNPLAFDPGPSATFHSTTFPPGATTPNDANQSAYVINPNVQGSYPAALTAGTPIGPLSSFDFQEGDNFQASGKWIRANRLIDEDQTQIDQVLGGRPASGVQVPFNGPNFVGLAGQVRYLGLKMDLNDFNSADAPGLYSYGWIGIRITNEADATGEVVGYAYETIPGVPIVAGNVPEPTSLVTALIGGAAIVGGFVMRRVRRS